MPISLPTTRTLAVTAAAVAGALLAPSAANAVVTIGPPMSSYDGESVCDADTCAVVHQSLPSLYDGRPSFNVTLPENMERGIIVRYRISGSGTFGGLFTGRYTSDAKVAFVRSETTGDVKLNHPDAEPPWIPLKPGKPIVKGEHIGLLLRKGARLMQNDVPSAVTDFWNPALDFGVPTPIGTKGFGGGALNRATRVAFQALVERDDDNDGLGDESQDPTPPGGPQPTPPNGDPGIPQLTKPDVKRETIGKNKFVTIRTMISEGGVVTLAGRYKKAGSTKVEAIKRLRSTRSSRGLVTFRLPPKFGKGSYHIGLVVFDYDGKHSNTVERKFSIR